MGAERQAVVAVRADAVVSREVVAPLIQAA
jgi:hypothetical protein